MKLSRTLLVDAVIGSATRQMLKLEMQSGSDRQHYHGLEHVSLVTITARTAAKRLVGGDENVWLDTIEVMGMGHDLIQKCDPAGMPHFLFPEVILRKRMRGPNEDQTADLVVQTIEELDEDNLFSDEELAAIDQGIRFTVPEWDNTAKTMIQPRMLQALDDKTAKPLAVSLAMGDLLLCGTNPDKFIGGSDGLLVEECTDLVARLLRAKSLSDIPQVIRDRHLDYFRFWDGGQAGFAAGQKKTTFQRVLDAFPKAADGLIKAFNGFKESGDRAMERANDRMTWSFEQYARQVGFRLPR